MKRLVSAALALTLLGSTAAVADPYHGGRHNHGGYSHSDRGYYRGHRGNDGAAIAAGFGILALAAILSSQHHRHHAHRYSDDRYDDRGYNDRGYNDYGGVDGGGYDADDRYNDGR